MKPFIRSIYLQNKINVFLNRLELQASLLIVLKALAIFKVSFNSAIGLGASTASLSRVPTVEGETSSCSGLGSALSRRRF